MSIVEFYFLSVVVVFVLIFCLEEYAGTPMKTYDKSCFLPLVIALAIAPITFFFVVLKFLEVNDRKKNLNKLD